MCLLVIVIIIIIIIIMAIIILIVIIVIIIMVSNHGEAGLLVWNRVFSKDLRFPVPSFLSLHYSLISSTVLRICADPSRVDFWMVSKESDTPTMARKDVRQSVIVSCAPIIIGMPAVCTPQSFEISCLSFSYFSIFSFFFIWVLISPGQQYR